MTTPQPEKLKRFERLLVGDIVSRSRLSIDGKVTTTAAVCEPVLRFAIQVLNCACAEVWSVDPRRRQLILVADTAPNVDRLSVLNTDESLTGEVVDTRRISPFNTHELSHNHRRFADTGFRDKLVLGNMLSVPLKNISNPHQVLAVVNMYWRGDQELLIKEKDRKRLQTFSTILASSIENSLRENAHQMAALVGHAITENEGLLSYRSIESSCKSFETCVKKALSCDWVDIFLRDPVDGKIKAQNADRSVQKKKSTVPRMVWDVWKKRREFLSPRVGDECDPSDFFIGKPDGIDEATVLLVPIQDLVRGKCVGVVQCVRLRKSAARFAARFTYDDIAIVEAMNDAFFPILETVLESEKRRLSLQKLSHELRNPISVFREMITTMKNECREKDFQFSWNHFREGEVYTDLMTRLLTELNIIRFGPSTVPMKFHRTNILTEVVHPALKFTKRSLSKYKFKTHQLCYYGFGKFPELKVDPALVTQVVFNLLDNAIKYYTGDRQQFKCNIIGIVQRNEVKIIVQDNGPGLPTEGDSVFEYGVRQSKGEFGEGLGLWISRGIAERHRGTLKIGTNEKSEFIKDSWTTFELALPRDSIN